MAGSITALAKLGIGATSTVTDALDYQEFSPGVRRELRDTNGTRGKFSKDGNRVRVNRNVVSPRLRCEPTVTEWTKLLPWLMGGTPSGSPTVTYPLGNVTPTRYVHHTPNAGESYLLSGVGVDSATIRASSGEPISLDLELLGQTYDAAPAGFPSLTLDVTTQPFILSDLSLSVGGSTRNCRDLSFSLRNNLDRGRYLNSLNLTAVHKLNRQVAISVSVPSGDNPGLWDDGADGVAVVATFTNPSSGSILVLSAVDWRFTPTSPEHPFNGEGFLGLEGELYMSSGGTESLVITLTP